MASQRHSSSPRRAVSAPMDLRRPSGAPLMNNNFSRPGSVPTEFCHREFASSDHESLEMLERTWTVVSKKHREKLELLSKVAKWELGEFTINNGNVVCFQKKFLIGRGNQGTEVYICLGTDGIERAIKRIPKSLCDMLKNERDILTSRNAVESPRVVNYHFYDNTSNPDFGYLILNLYEQNLEEFVKKEGETITESHAREMIRQVLEGLKALHAREPRIIHRDLKPTNILVDVNGNLVLSDFGIGRFFPEQGIFLRCMQCSVLHKYSTLIYRYDIIRSSVVFLAYTASY